MSISVDLARQILEACRQRARDLRSPVSITIVDAGGHLVLFERMMAPYGWATGDISMAKANTAVMFNQSTDAVAQWASAIPGFAASLASMTTGKFIMAAGGWPIRVNGVTIGGIGVSGGNAPGRDDEIARAGLSIVEVAIARQARAAQQQQSQPIQEQPLPSQPVGYAAQPMPSQPGAYASQQLPSQPSMYVNGVSTPSVAQSAVNRESSSRSQERPSTQHLPEAEEQNYSAYREEKQFPANADQPGDQQ